MTDVLYLRPHRQRPRWADRLRGPILGLLVATLAAGCTAGGQIPYGGYERDQVQIMHEVSFPPSNVNLDAAAMSELDAFIASARVGPTDAVMVAATGPLGSSRRQTVINRLAELGITAAALPDDAGTGDAVTVVVDRTVPLPTACYRESYVVNGDVMPPLGCANAVNLARMVVDPNDLYRGRTPGPADAAPAVLAIERYRTGQITPLEKERLEK